MSKIGHEVFAISDGMNLELVHRPRNLLKPRSKFSAFLSPDVCTRAKELTNAMRSKYAQSNEWM
jgi:hypothetical protein